MSCYSLLKTDFIVHVVGPLLFVLVSPSLVLLLWSINRHYDGSLSAAYEVYSSRGFWSSLLELWRENWAGSALAWLIITAFAGLQLLLMKLLPGSIVKGARTPAGHVPEYKDNGLLCFAVTMALYIGCVYRVPLLNPTRVYQAFGQILGALSLLSFSFCAFLYVKGIFCPTSERAGHVQRPLFDFYWGTELHPRILGWDVKQFTNCRFGMMSWSFIILSFAHAQYELYGHVADSMLLSVLLQLIYIVKFYWWEAGYLRSLDIMHDRAGFYICWGCMVWVPGFYTLTVQYLVTHPVVWGWPWPVFLLLLGLACIFLNFDADRQRKLARDRGGHCNIWGEPAQYMTALYSDSNGQARETILLTSGWWGISRHFHYIPELLAALCWCTTAQCQHLMPYLYVIFLSLLLLERAFRDDVRCREKYGTYWDQYCEKVKYLIVPGVL